MINLDLIKKYIDNDDILKLSDLEFTSYLNNVLINYASENNIEFEINQIKHLTKLLFYDYRGLGLIDYFLEEDQVNEIMINSYDQIFIEKSGDIYKSKLKFNSREDLDRIIQKIVSDSGREVNISNPIVDARLYDGSRVNIVLPPISKDSPYVTIRKFSKKRLGIEDLIKTNTLDEETANFLKRLVKAKYNIVIGGGTSSGKTTFLNALSNFIDKKERIITIEDSRELQIQDKENLISLESRNPNTSNKGQISIRDLIKNSLRMRPDRIIVGEVRSEETLDMLQAMNTGHDGSLTTAHANSSLDMVSRLETMILRGNAKIPMEAIKRMINSSIEIIIHLERVKGGKRRLVEISELLEDENANSKINILYKYDYNSDRLNKVGHMVNTYKLERME